VALRPDSFCEWSVKNRMEDLSQGQGDGPEAVKTSPCWPITGPSYVLPKMMGLTDVGKLGPDSGPWPMLLGHKNQYRVAHKLLAQLPVQRWFLSGWPMLSTNLLDMVEDPYPRGEAIGGP